MKYYSNWQDALKDFINQCGHTFSEPYNLIEEFEQILQQNKKGTYYIVWKI